ncbi:nascent polypeptide-associated complex subunit alpha, muscle-specific form-like [Topomyia yanbarensis]|uniref:nascent polypeptide-associated complex subunit alpha, muscle-specific form-like n=1 Tax=Topomyia yanbarensis TaxID=2498891 RepID=UPI00273A751B|nr:nascent polypeptide-associated complex subunit alpha, muscle-specific form-like [Topomyia yanbarensis]
MKFKIVVIFTTILLATSHAQLICYHCDDCDYDVTAIQPCGFDNTILTPPDWGQSTISGGANDPILTPPGGDSSTGNPLDPILTPPTVPGGDGSGTVNPGDPILTPPNNGGGESSTGNPGDPILTPPNNGGGESSTGNPGDPILTPPNNGGGGGSTGNPGDPILTPPNNGGSEVNTANPGNPILTPPTFPRDGGVGVKGIELSSEDQQYVCLMTNSVVNGRNVIRRGCTQLGSNNDETCSRVSGGLHKHCAICNTHLCNSGA